MKLADLDFDDKKKWLKITDFENIFDINIDKKENYCYNLNQTIYFNVSDSSFSEYICTNVMSWPLISYTLYGTTRLAWILMKFNNVNASNVFNRKYPGDIVKYIQLEQLQDIISTIND